MDYDELLDLTVIWRINCNNAAQRPTAGRKPLSACWGPTVVEGQFFHSGCIIVSLETAEKNTYMHRAAYSSTDLDGIER